MSEESSNYELSRKIDHYLAAIAKLYEYDNERDFQELIVNSQPLVHEEWNYDSWNGGTAGHALYLVLPEPLFLTVARRKEEIQDRIKNDLNSVHNVSNEYIAEVFIEMEAGDGNDWRASSGLLLTGKRSVPQQAIKRIWADDSFRVFLSHKSEVKRETADLKQQLALYGISAFVAHEDIHPTQAWQDEIENALQTMDAFVAIMTPTFHESDWTDQEVGFALARGVPLIAVRLGRNPYGFIGKFQALPGSWSTAAEDIAGILIKNDRMFSIYVNALRRCNSFDEANMLGRLLPNIISLKPQQVDELILAHNENSEVQWAFAFSGAKPHVYGPGLVSHLNRLDSRKFRRDATRLIVPI